MHLHCASVKKSSNKFYKGKGSIFIKGDSQPCPHPFKLPLDIICQRLLTIEGLRKKGVRGGLKLPPKPAYGAELAETQKKETG